MPRAVCIGECMLEFSMRTDKSFGLGYAGDTFNTAWYLRARLPAEWNVDYCTAVGDDFYSSQMLQFFSENGIGTSCVKRLPNHRPGLYVIRQEAGDRHFSYWRGQAAAKHLADEPDFLEAALKGAELVYFSGITLAILDPKGRKNLLAQIQQAKSKGVKIAFDPNERPALWRSPAEMRRALTSAARLSDFVFPTFSDEKLHFGDLSPQDVAARYLTLGAGEVVVKNGESPALIALDGIRLESTPEALADPADTTAAGDSFNGAYLAARLKGVDPQRSAALAHGVARQVISHIGALVPMAMVR